ncbi:uncharacterized protein LOC132168948 [Corylus avellana]|uniref:uncharacterized protein LOC132168948 n=1 Tax=Corylus avellana TaxID=13451 RepID=UPI00286BAB55|nr:uncharacterized protein LOC132168948 [Corylus avellana]
MELQHFFHHHPLAWTYYTAYGETDKECEGCGEGILGFSYSCQMCDFFLHKSCGEQPRKLKHPLHPKHPLILRESPDDENPDDESPCDESPDDENPDDESPDDESLDDELCYFCNKYMDRFSGFAYKCSHCNVSLHLKCASIPFTLKPEFHDHPLKLLRKSHSFTCDACGKQDEDMYSYVCTSLTCSFMVHQKCAALPLTLKHTSHHHTLDLTHSSQLNQSHRQICRLCVKKVDTDRAYYCSKCNFVAHLVCATREGETEEIKKPLESTGILKNEDSELDESIDSLPYAVKKMKIGEDKIEIPVEIEHFSHQHDLKLTEELLNKEQCDGCMLPISTSPSPQFYSCAQCRFFLHKSCAELSRKKRHSLHPHLLTLFAKAPYPFGGVSCNVCDRSCEGFIYHCKECYFDADVQCSLISDILPHDGHEHPLILSRAPVSENCSCCDNSGRVFKCADCEFTLDVKCATLPHTMRYRSFEQPFKLCYKAEDDYEDDEYYCDICEKKRNSKHWFYYCADMSFSAHPNCILGKYPYCKRLASTTSL